MFKNISNLKSVFNDFVGILSLLFTVIFYFLIIPLVSNAAAPTTFTIWTVSPLTSTVGTTVSASWSANNSPTAYYIIIREAGITSEVPVGLSTTWSDKPAVGTFYVKIKACNAGGCTTSAEKTVTVNPLPPTTFNTWTVSPLTSTEGTTVNASWSANNSPTSYSLIIDGVETSMGMATTFSMKPAVGTYDVGIKACNLGGCYTNPSKKTVTVNPVAVAKPTTFNTWTVSPLTSTVGTIVSASWSANNSPTSYSIIINEGGKITKTPVGLSTSWADKPAVGTFVVSIEACNAGGCLTSPSKTVTVTEEKPTSSWLSLSLTSVATSGELTASWSGNNSPSSYKMKVNSIVYDMGPVTSWTGTPDSLTPKLGVGSYNISSQACNSGGCSDWSDLKPFEVINSSETAPTSASINLIQYLPYTTILDNFSATWSGNNSPSSYNIKVNSTVYDMSSDTSWTGSPTSFALPAGTHYISVQACNSGGCSDWSPAKTLVLTSAMPRPGKAKVSISPKSVATNENFTASWSGDVNSYYYNVLVGSKLYNAGMYFGATNTWTGTPESLGLYPSTYPIYFQACNTGGCGDWSDPAELKVTSPVAGKPTLSSFDVGPSTVPVEGTLTASWSGNNSPTYYTIRLDGSTIYASVPETYWTGSPAMLEWHAGPHKVAVQACNVFGCSDWSADKVIDVTGAVVGTAPTTADINIRLAPEYILTPINGFCANWSGNNSPTNYNIKVGSTVYIMGGADNWCGTPSQLGLTDGSYSVYVQACNLSGCGPWSSAKPLVVYPIATPPTVSNIWVDKPSVTATDTITVKWDGNNVPNGYNVMVDSLIYNVGASTMWKGTPDSIGLGVGVHTLKSQACNSGGCSPWSSEITVSRSPSSVVIGVSPTISFIANPTSVVSGNESKLTWSTTNADTCMGIGGQNGWNGSSPVTSNAIGWMTGAITSPQTFTLRCTNAGGGIAERSVTVNVGVAPLVVGDITAPDCYITTPGKRTCTTTVSWNATGLESPKIYVAGKRWKDLYLPEHMINSDATTTHLGGWTFNLQDNKSSGMVIVKSVIARALCGPGLVYTYDSATGIDTCELDPASVVAPAPVPPTPIITITPQPSLVRNGQIANVSVDIESLEQLNCQVFGVDDHGDAVVDGIESFTHEGGSTSPHEFTTKNLTSTQYVKVICEVDSFPSVVGTAETRINVIGTAQEI
jgi:predicted heme/steroid binding protein